MNFAVHCLPEEEEKGREQVATVYKAFEEAQSEG